MFDKSKLKSLVTYVLITGLFVLAFLVIRPIIFSIIYGILIAYIMFPPYKLISKRIKNNTLAATLFCLLLLVVVIVISYLFFQFLFRQLINFYLGLQKFDLSPVIQNLLPSYLSKEVSAKIVNSVSSALSSLVAGFLNSITDFIVNLPEALLHLSIVIFVFFFTLRDGEKAVEYFKSLSPLKKETEERFFKQFKAITNSVLIGHVVIGIMQGIIAGIGYYLFGVSNVALLTVLTIIAAIIPVVGPWLIWVPVDIYLFTIGNSAAGLGFLIYGTILVSTLENFIRPLIVSRGTEVNSMIILIGMIGGLFAFGVLGIIIGPLVLAYVLLVIELYRKNTMTDELIFKKAE
jgi:predicted PurR-regulated permease PerM